MISRKLVNTNLLIGVFCCSENKDSLFDVYQFLSSKVILSYTNSVSENFTKS
jgi:hypothetical protein